MEVQKEKFYEENIQKNTSSYENIKIEEVIVDEENTHE